MGDGLKQMLVSSLSISASRPRACVCACVLNAMYFLLCKSVHRNAGNRLTWVPHSDMYGWERSLLRVVWLVFSMRLAPLLGVFN